jgi:FMN phosphatase YigB (HAD superfamily)
MSSGEVLLFDLDGTLFDPSAFMKSLLHLYAVRFSLDEQALLQLQLEHRSLLDKGSDFDPDQFLTFISGKTQVPIREMSDMFWHEKKVYEQAVFPDVFPTLKSLQKRKTSMGVFSEGYSDYQRQKIIQSGLDIFFAPASIRIFQKKLTQENIDSLPKNCLVVDNQKEVVLTLMQSKVKVIWINRETDEKLPDIQTIYSLQELI